MKLTPYQRTQPMRDAIEALLPGRWRIAEWQGVGWPTGNAKHWFWSDGTAPCTAPHSALGLLRIVSGDVCPWICPTCREALDEFFPDGFTRESPR